MRIISGSARGRRLEPPAGMTTRPTTDKVKESLFSIIQFRLPDAAVLDLFAGSGQLGLEALSRGAATCVFTEKDRKAQLAVQKNIEACEFGRDRARLFKGDAYSFLASCEKHSFDIILMDPPYGGELLKKALESVSRFDILSEDGIIICEKAPEDVIEPLPEGFIIDRQYKYGQIMLCKIVKEEKEI